ncbi:uncharacterized protein ACIQIH_009573 isoform 2-T6 [Cyanocitta cristata]
MTVTGLSCVLVPGPGAGGDSSPEPLWAVRGGCGLRSRGSPQSSAADRSGQGRPGTPPPGKPQHRNWILREMQPDSKIPLGQLFREPVSKEHSF